MKVMQNQDRISTLARKIVAQIDDMTRPEDLKELAGTELSIKFDENGKIQVVSRAQVQCW